MSVYREKGDNRGWWLAAVVALSASSAPAAEGETTSEPAQGPRTEERDTQNPENEGAGEPSAAAESDEAGPTTAPSSADGTGIPNDDAQKASTSSAGEANAAQVQSADPEGQGAVEAEEQTANEASAASKQELSAQDVTEEESTPPEQDSEAHGEDKSRPRVIEVEDDTPLEPPADPNTLPYTHHQLHYDVGLGVRLSWVGDSLYDAFSENDLLPQVNARVGAAFWKSGPWSVAALVDWSSGSTGALTRGQTASLAAHRFGLGIEARYHLHERVFVYGRAAPGAMFAEARIGGADDPSSPYTNTWAFSLDGALGGTVRLAGSADGRQDTPRLHGYLEGGYGFVSEMGLTLSSNPEEGPSRPQPLELGALSLSAPFAGAGLLLTF